MMLAEFEALLKETIGLDSASIGLPAIENAVQHRLVACRLPNVEAYREYLHTSATELQELIEAIVVPETWFFRDGEPFVVLARLAHEQWLRNRSQGVLRLLSLPCSTGEEPYSMAMALMDSGFPLDRFRIDAVDISLRALTHAQRAVYGKNSFRGKDLDFRDRHFQVTPHGYQLNERVQRQVDFQQSNLFDDNLLPGTAIYDVIFCRNVLIYFDRATQDRVIKVLTRLLSDDGLLFVGPAETGLLLAHDFVSMKLPLAFAFRKAAPESRTLPIEAAQPAKPVLTKPATALRAKATPQRAPKLIPPAQSEPSNISIDEIEQLANAGQFAEATRHCEEHLRAQGPSAKAFYLLGLMRDAAGNPIEATEAYRKALYLDPNHCEAIVHLAFLLEKGGDFAAAQVLQQRARRLMQK